MRTFAVGDIHGGLKGLEQLLHRIQVYDTDCFIFLGDYVDGWSESAQVIEYLIEFSKRCDCVFIKGNHDVWCESWLRNGEGNSVWLHHGGKETIDSYQGYTEAEKKAHLHFFEDMQYYHIDPKNRLFLHAGFTSMHGVEREVHKENFYFDRTLWEMALAMSHLLKKEDIIYPQRLKHYQEIYIGHTPTINYKQTEPMNAINVWNVDTGAAFTGKLSAIDIDSKVIIQSEPLIELYPNEKGRNR
ncbi:metallophosphoesterase family protein [Psychroserpens sp. BH13MA-6]